MRDPGGHFFDQSRKGIYHATTKSLGLVRFMAALFPVKHNDCLTNAAHRFCPIV